MPIGIYCRQNLTNKRSDGVEGPHDRDLRTVASPDYSAINSVFHTAGKRDHHDPEALGRCAAKMLLSQGAGALLNPVAGAAK